MGLTARGIAENASFHAFINGYFREIDAGEWCERELWYAQADFQFTLSGAEVVEVYLPSATLRVLMDVSYRSKVGRHHFHGVFTREEAVDGEQYGNWQRADLMYLQIAFVREIYRRQTISSGGIVPENFKINEMELLGRLLDSYQLMTHYLDARSNDASLNSCDFIDSEQSILFGHWLHPTPKSRQGIAFWQQAHYSPELRGHFKLHYFSVSNNLVMQGSALAKSASEIIFDELTRYEKVELAPDHVLIPVHPLQAHNLLLEDWVRKLLADGSMVYLGERGAQYTPTSSVRTVFNADSQWMIKLSIPVKITNSLRTNKRRELEDGMVVERYLRDSGFFSQRSHFKIISDPAYITVNLPGDKEQDSGFEVVLRRNHFVKDKGQGVCSLLALAQDPIPSIKNPMASSLLKQIIQSLAIDEGRSDRDVTLDWFQRYWSCSVESLIVLYDRYGIALEAHQQNSLLDVSKGYPSCYYYRDNQGFYLSRQYSDALANVADKLNLTDIFYDDDKIFTAISYYVFVNQLFAIIYRLGADGLIEEEILIERCRHHLLDLRNKMQGVGKAFIDYILNSEQLGFKTNLLARINNIDELQEGMEHCVYSTVVNPLFVVPEMCNDHCKDNKEQNDVAYV